jgi:hypothetical protein
VGQFLLNWVVNPVTDLGFRISPTGSIPFSEKIVNTFDSTGDVPWIIEERSNFGDASYKQIRITESGANALQTQTLFADMVISGRNANIAPLVKIGHARFNFRLFVTHPDGKSTLGLLSTDSWMESFVFDPNAPETQPMTSASIMIPPGTLQAGSVIRIQGFAIPYDLLDFLFTEGVLKGSTSAPDRGAAFGMRLYTQPIVYKAMNPLQTAWFQQGFGGAYPPAEYQTDATLHVKNKPHTHSHPYDLGFASFFPWIQTSTYSFFVFKTEIVFNNPFSGVNSLLITILDETLLKDQFLLVDLSVTGTSNSGKNRVFSMYVCINFTAAGDLCSIEPLVIYQERSHNMQRNIYNMFLIPNQYLTTGAEIHIYGDVYAGGTETLNTQSFDQTYPCNFVITLRSQYNVYPG